MNKLPYNVRTTTVREYAGGSSVGGILRKTGTSHNSNNSSGQTNNANGGGDGRQIELLVFGYACKVFRDDDKARDIDQGKHLIPWMGDANLKIDRYDVRGALCDLGPYEAPPGGYGNRLDYLTADEQRAEQLCEEERYLYLYNNEEEHILQQEEDLKRLKQESEGGNFSQVDFRYGVGAESATTALEAGTEEVVDGADEIEQPFVLPTKLVVPAHLQLPETMKQHAIIEKTARFIASQGVQMEILLKAKQSNNVQFEFLTQNSALNAYYKHLVEAIKQGTYPAETYQVDQLLEPNKPSTETESVSETNGALTTVNVSSKKPVITVPTIKYKPSANCAYTQLISKIRGVPLQTVIDEDGNSNNSGINSPTTSIKSTNSGEFMPVLLQYNGSTFAHAEDGDASNTGSVSNGGNNDTNNGDSGDGVAKVEVFKNTSALALAQNYCTDSDETDNDDVDVPAAPILNFPIPEDNLRHIIDKTATYVIKNGRQFEETLRAKSVERFTFLLPDNEYYPYYMYKITDDPNAASKEQKTRKAAAVAAALLSKKGLTAGAVAIDKQMTPVSFSIKPKDEHPPLQPALPQEPSDDETEQEVDANANGSNGTTSNVDRQVPERVQKAIQLVEAQLLARNGVTAPQQPETHSPEHCRQKEIKKAEEKFKDKLAQIAREKLGGLLSKEKQLQLERKRKAMAFLNQIKSGDGATAKVQNAVVSGAEESTTSTDLLKTLTQQTAENEKTHNNDDDDSDASSVRSIPITSYGPEDDDDEPEEPQNETTKHKEDADKVAQVTAATTKAPTVLLSDDDDVQLVGETSPPLADITSLSAYAKRALEKRSSKYATVERQSKRTEGDSDRHHSRHKAKKPHKDTQAESKRRQYRRSTHKRARSRSRSTSQDTDSDSETSSDVSTTSTDDSSSDSEASRHAMRRRAKKSSRMRHKSSSTKKSDMSLGKKRRARSRSHDEIHRSQKSARYDVVAEQEEALAYLRQREKKRERASSASSKQKYHQSSSDRRRRSRSRSKSNNSQASKRSKRSSSRYGR